MDSPPFRFRRQTGGAHQYLLAVKSAFHNADLT